MLLWFDEYGVLKEQLDYGQTARVGTTAFQIVAHFDNLDASNYESAVIFLRKPDLQGTRYPALYMTLSSLTFDNDIASSNYFKEENNPYPVFVFDFNEVKDTDNDTVVTLLDTPGLWEATIVLIGSTISANVVGTATFEVESSAISDPNADNTEIPFGVISSGIATEIATKVSKNGIYYIRSCEDLSTALSEGTLLSTIFVENSYVLDQATKGVYKLTDVVSENGYITSATTTLVVPLSTGTDGYLVDISSRQTITGVKTFSNGLNVSWLYLLGNLIGDNSNSATGFNYIESNWIKINQNLTVDNQIIVNSIAASYLGANLDGNNHDISNINWLESTYATINALTINNTISGATSLSLRNGAKFGITDDLAVLDLYGTGYITGVDSIDTNKISVHNSFMWTNYEEYDEEDEEWVGEAHVYYFPDFVYNAETSPYATVHKGEVTVPKTSDNTLATEGYVNNVASTKQNVLTAGAGISITGNTISANAVIGLDGPYASLAALQSAVPVGASNIIYFVTNSSGASGNLYDEYIWNTNNNSYEMIGTVSSSVDLTNYYNKTESDNKYVDLTSTQTITGVKTFTMPIYLGSGTQFTQASDDSLQLTLSGDGKALRPSWDGHYNLGSAGYKWKDLYLGNALHLGSYAIAESDSSGTINFSNTQTYLFTFNTVLRSRTVQPLSSNSFDLGTSSLIWKDLYLSGVISNGTNTYTLPTATGTLALTSDLGQQWQYYLGGSYGACYYLDAPNDDYSIQIGDSGFTVDSGATESQTHQTVLEVSNTVFQYKGSDIALKSDIPTVNDGTLTIQQNGSTIGTFTANNSGNVTANIITPTTPTYYEHTVRVRNTSSETPYGWFVFTFISTTSTGIFGTAGTSTSVSGAAFSNAWANLYGSNLVQVNGFVIYSSEAKQILELQFSSSRLNITYADASASTYTSSSYWTMTGSNWASVFESVRQIS